MGGASKRSCTDTEPEAAREGGGGTVTSSLPEEITWNHVHDGWTMKAASVPVNVQHTDTLLPNTASHGAVSVKASTPAPALSQFSDVGAAIHPVGVCTFMPTVESGVRLGT
jgi:hypothetical protein